MRASHSPIRRSRNVPTVAVVASLALSAAGLALGATAAAAAPAVIAPEYVNAIDAPPLSSEGMAGFQVLTVDGEPSAANVAWVASDTNVVAQFRDPAGSTAHVIDPALAGTFSIAISNSGDGPMFTQYATNPSGPVHANFYPQQTTFYSDSWMYTTGGGSGTGPTWTYTLDFSGLAGGVLPAGSAFNVSDTDICAGTNPVRQGESTTITSDKTGAWMDYVTDRIYSGVDSRPVITLDEETGAYVVAPNPSCRDINMANWFTTVDDVSTLTIVTTASPLGGGQWWGLRGPAQSVNPSIEVVKTTNGQDVASAPGATLTVGSAVSWGYRVTNTGNTLLADVSVTDDKVDSSLISCAGGTNVITSLAAGESVDCVATGTAIEGQYANTATVVGTPVNRSGELLGEVKPTHSDSSWYLGVLVPHLTFSKTVNAAQAEVGSTLEYTITVVNDGQGDSGAFQIEDTLPAGTSFVSASDGGTHKASVVTWNLTGLAQGASKSVTVRVDVTKAAAGTTITNKAGLAGTVIPAVPTTETACADSSSQACADTVVSAPALAATGAGDGVAHGAIALTLVLSGLGIAFASRRSRSASAH